MVSLKTITFKVTWCTFEHCVGTTLDDDSCVLTDENWAEEESDGDVDDGRGHVQKPVGAHGKESQEEQKEEQAVLVLLNLMGD